MRRRALGVDISHWQGAPDFNQMRAGGASFVFCKASQNNWKDNQFERNWSASKDAGLLRGAYHFLDMREGALSAGKQARFFSRELRKDIGELRPVLDFEFPGIAGYPELPENPICIDLVSDFATVINGELGIWPMLYTNLNGVQRLSPLSDFMKNIELWIAWYNVEKHSPKIGLWPNWRFWQYKATGNGKLFGVESNGLDMNVFNGTEEDLLSYVDEIGLSSKKPMYNFKANSLSAQLLQE